MKRFETRLSLILQVLKPMATKQIIYGHIGQLFASFYQYFSFITFEMPLYLVQQGFQTINSVFSWL